MRFILQMARREMRASWRRLLFFFICIAIGVGSIVALRSIIQNIGAAVSGEARALLTADVMIDSGRPWSEEALAKINHLAGPVTEGRVETIESATMAVPADPRRDGALTIELKGIEPPFPLVGDFKLTDGRHFDYSLIQNGGAVVSPALLDRLGLRVGEAIKIGTLTFEIRGAFDQEPGGAGGFRLGPRVFIERAALEAAGLTGFGSRARRRILLTTRPGQMEPLVRRLRAELRNERVSVRSYRDSQENLNESLTRAENYLSLTGLIILVLGGIGIANVTRVFVEQKKKTIAVLKCVGGTGTKITAVYLLQVLTLGLVGSLLGVALARAALYACSVYFADSLPQNLDYGLRPGAILQGLGLGLLISLLFSAVPLLRIRRIKPNALLRDDADAGGRRFDLARVAATALVLVGLLLTVSWQAGSLQVGLYFLGGLAATALALYLAAWLIIVLVRRAKGFSSFTLRQTINSLHRPGNQTRVIVMVVGLGVFLVIATRSLQANLVKEFDINRRGDLPNMFMIDIQKDQAEPLAALVEQQLGTRPLLVPTVRARIAAINGNAVDFDQAEMRRERGRLGREYVVTFRPNLESNEQIVAGQFWDAAPSPDAEVSVEESMKGLAGLDVGSTMTFDIQGRKLTARVTSLRRVDWRNSRTGFMILFRPGPLENAPQMLVGAINGPAEEVARTRFQRAVLDQFPNVTVVDVAEIVRTVKRILDNVTLAITFIGAFVFLSGALILIGSVAMTKFQRIYEAAVLKTLGAKRRTLLTILFMEYGLLGLVAGLIGSGAAVGLSYVTSRYVLDIPWSFTPAINLTGVVATVILVTVVGALSTIDVLSKKPLAILRGQ